MRYFPKVLKLAYKFTSTSADGLVSSFIGCFDGVEELKGVDDMIIFHLLGYILYYSIMFYCDELIPVTSKQTEKVFFSSSVKNAE